MPGGCFHSGVYIPAVEEPPGFEKTNIPHYCLGYYPQSHLTFVDSVVSCAQVRVNIIVEAFGLCCKAGVMDLQNQSIPETCDTCDDDLLKCAVYPQHLRVTRC
jgi:hypothetical protein